MNFETQYHAVTPEEIIYFHRRFEETAPGLAGMADDTKAQAVYDRVKMLYHYGELPDVWSVGAAYMQAISRGHIFSDYNKRTSLMCAVVFLARNGELVELADPELVELVVRAATGEAERPEIAAELQRLAK
ncbi:type II toxin-antitoxin system death-on-curing family toxin [Salmonella enterica]|nr:type II toxin-antitoxin system death-on-curing family toxin [Salmonella enterica]